MRHLFPDDYTNSDLRQVLKSQLQSNRWKEIAEYELQRRKIEWNYIGNNLDLVA